MTLALVRAAHPGPAFAVTVLAALLTIPTELSPWRALLVVGAVLAGQLSIGWSNDLIDLRRDRQVQRLDKPLAAGTVDVTVVRWACALAVVVAVGLSLACGPVAGPVHLLLVASGWAYNLGLKSTPWSWAPYAVAFGGLPVFVELAAPGAGLPPAWVPVAAGLLGVGAHLVNALPDLEDDEATGVRGLPHRIGARWTPRVAVAVLVLASLTIVVGADGVPPAVVVTVLVLVLALALAALIGRGSTPFRAAVAIALVDAMMVVWAR